MRHVASGQRWGVSAASDQGVSCAVKDGWLPRPRDGGRWIINSIGVVHVYHHVLLLSVLSSYNPSQAEGIATVEHVASVVRRSLGPGQALLPRFAVAAHVAGSHVGGTTIATGTVIEVIGVVRPRTAGGAIALQQRIGGRWRTVTTSHVSRAGVFTAFWTAGDAAAEVALRVVRAGDRAHRMGWSRTIEIDVRSRWQVSGTIAPNPAATGSVVTFVGAVAPATSGLIVHLTTVVNGSRVVLATSTTDRAGRFVFATPAPAPGAIDYQFVVPASGSFLTGLSPSLTLTVAG